MSVSVDWRPDPPSIEVGAHHVGAPQSPHAPPGTVDPHDQHDMPRKVRLLAAKLGLEWCVDCGDWHEIAGGSSATRSETPPPGTSETAPFMADGL